MRHFHVKDRENDKLNNEEKMIFKLFFNESEWIKNIDNFTSAKIQGRTTEATRYILSDLKSYSDKIQAFDDGDPNPKKSDKCLASLANGKLNSHGICTIDKSCYEVLKNGTNYGYALTHRLLLLQMAQYSRRCSIFSKSEDRYFSNRFCSMLYVEAEFIAIQNFEDGLVDLMLEIICLCGLHGHAQFLNRTWLDRIKRFQTPYGCFSLDLKKMEHTIRQESLRWKLYRNRDYDILEGLCNEHVTSLAMATYAEAVRFILEIYY
ncbi:UPF0764 protein C16orf89 homolog [Pieris rapae]|uniref:UPF0764 protein C16orf89 homolog n=1 Tax=Pieris rapae TaxID=64459 RepID=UPI001E27B500|nr:UPF0764 protein C16orf89 homolog [Pieris rapae]